MSECDHAWTNVLPSGYVTLAWFCLTCGEVDAYRSALNEPAHPETDR